MQADHARVEADHIVGVVQRGQLGLLPCDQGLDGLDGAGENSAERLVAVLIRVVQLREHFFECPGGVLLLLLRLLRAVLRDVLGGVIERLFELRALTEPGGLRHGVGLGGVDLPHLLAALLELVHGLGGLVGEFGLLAGDRVQQRSFVA